MVNNVKSPQWLFTQKNHQILVLEERQNLLLQMTDYRNAEVNLIE